MYIYTCIYIYMYMYKYFKSVQNRQGVQAPATEAKAERTETVDQLSRLNLNSKSGTHELEIKLLGEGMGQEQ